MDELKAVVGIVLTRDAAYTALSAGGVYTFASIPQRNGNPDVGFPYTSLGVASMVEENETYDGGSNLNVILQINTACLGFSDKVLGDMWKRIYTLLHHAAMPPAPTGFSPIRVLMMKHFSTAPVSGLNESIGGAILRVNRQAIFYRAQVAYL